MTGAELVVVADAEAAAREASRRLAAAVEARAEIVLAGGSTPRRSYQLAAAEKPDWSGVGVWLSDERCVPTDDELANTRLVREALLDGLEAQPLLHRVRTELGADAAADAYDAELRDVTIELALLGLGADGHTASLFPGSPAVEVADRLAVATEAGLAPWVPRITLTVPALSAARHVVFLAVGEEKAEAVARAFAAAPAPSTPASLVRGRDSTTVILDSASARLVRSADD